MVEGLRTGAITVNEETIPSLTGTYQQMFADWRTLNEGEAKNQTDFWKQLFINNDGEIDAGEQQILETIQGHYSTKATEMGTLEGNITTIIGTALSEQRGLSEAELAELDFALQELEGKGAEIVAKQRLKAEAEQEAFLRDLATGRMEVTQETYDNYIAAVEQNEMLGIKAANDVRTTAMADAKYLLSTNEITEEDYANMVGKADTAYFEEVGEVYNNATAARQGFADAVQGQMGILAESYVEYNGAILKYQEEIDSLCNTIDELRRKRHDEGGLSAEDDAVLQKAENKYNEFVEKEEEFTQRVDLSRG